MNFFSAKNLRDIKQVELKKLNAELTKTKTTLTFLLTTVMTETIKPINESIKVIFIQNMSAINLLNFNERNYNSRINKTPSLDILKTIDNVASQYIRETQVNKQQPPSLIDVNEYIYSAAISVNPYLRLLSENTPRFKWNYPQESIYKTQRDIGHIMTITERKKK